MSRPAARSLVALVVASAAMSCASQAQAIPSWLAEAQTHTASLVAGDSAAVAQVLHDRVELSIDSSLRMRRHEVRAVRILKPAGADLTSFVFGMEPGSRRKVARAWIVGHGRELATTESDVAETTLDPEHYTDYRRVIIRVPAPRVGDVMGVEFSSEEVLPFASYTWLPQFGGLPVARAELSVELPKGWGAIEQASGCVLSRGAGDDRIERFVGPIAGVPREPDAPSDALIAPRVRLRFTDGKGAPEFPDWRGVAAWYQRLTAEHYAADAVPSDLMSRAAGGGDRDRILALAREVQHRVGYAAIELGRERWEPDDAHATWTRHYGDCKDKSVLLVAALRALGVEARPALALVREAGVVLPDWPDPAQFNHCIVAVARPSGAPWPADGVRVKGPTGRDWFLFDPTDASTPLGALPWSLGGTYVVIADSAEGLARVPEIDAGEIRYQLAGTLSADGVLTGTLDLIGQGVGGAWVRARFEDASDAARKERMAALLAEGGTRTTVAAVRWLGTDSLRNETRLAADVTCTGTSRHAGRGLLFTPPVPFGFDQPPPEDESRRLAVWFGCRPDVIGRLEIALPEGLQSMSRDDRAYRGVAGEYTTRTRVVGSSLVVEREMKVAAESIPAKDWSSAKEMLQATYEGDREPIVLRAP